MAGLASRDRTIRPRLLHALFELTFMRISMTASATQIFPVINNRGLRLELRPLFVAFGARSCNVPSGQYEAGLFVFGQSEGGGFVSFEVMAAFASVEIRCRGELTCVLVRMTISATFELHLEQCVFAFRDVALGAFQTCMSALQRVRARSMFLDSECRRLPSVHVMARGALSAIGPLGELATVRIGLVAIHALLESQRLFEISASVALGTIDAGMLSFQRELRLGMVEAFVDCLKRNLLPSTGVVTGLATLRETAMMRIFVAVGTLVESSASVLRLAVPAVDVALRALHLGMQAGQRIACLRVIELRLA